MASLNVVPTTPAVRDACVCVDHPRRKVSRGLSTFPLFLSPTTETAHLQPSECHTWQDQLQDFQSSKLLGISRLMGVH